ncbi:MAG: hypothetical protein M1822_006430 [Bathelium mastoideum]|nr:MAG: hypothetical protein M1822_006430 [Bathelium mastoideum]
MANDTVSFDQEVTTKDKTALTAAVTRVTTASTASEMEPTSDVVEAREGHLTVNLETSPQGHPKSDAVDPLMEPAPFTSEKNEFSKADEIREVALDEGDIERLIRMTHADRKQVIEALKENIGWRSAYKALTTDLTKKKQALMRTRRHVVVSMHLLQQIDSMEVDKLEAKNLSEIDGLLVALIYALENTFLQEQREAAAVKSFWIALPKVKHLG